MASVALAREVVPLDMCELEGLWKRRNMSPGEGSITGEHLRSERTGV